MTQFDFRLETLLKFRQSARDQRRLVLSESRREEDRLRDQIAGLVRQLSLAKLACAQAAAPGAVQVDRLIEAQRYHRSLAARREALAKRRAALVDQIELLRNALVAADRDVLVLEKLKRKQQCDHRQQQQKLETQRLDEAALRCHAAASHADHFHD